MNNTDQKICQKLRIGASIFVGASLSECKDMTAGEILDKYLKCYRLFRPQFSKVKTSFFPEIR